MKNSQSFVVESSAADMAELADALASGASGRKAVVVRIHLSAPNDRQSFRLDSLI